jgi:Amt family ammonium transporter
MALLAGLALLVAPDLMAADEAPKPDAGDTAWMMTATTIVLMMTIPGLALFYGGMVRRKNILATVMYSFAATCLVTVLWMVIGYSLAFTDGGKLNNYLGGLGRFLLRNMEMGALAPDFAAPAEKQPAYLTIPESVFMMFQMTFAIITPALISGAYVDRIKFSAMLWFTGAWLILVYAPVAHWVWGGGFLGAAGVLDFAGGTVVHINAGIAGLVCALVLGKRMGYRKESMAPDNLVYTMIGASLLWVGWFGFNAGSAGAAGARAGYAMTATQIATAAAAMSWMFVEWAVRGKPSVLGILSGAVAGLVAITPAAGFVGPRGALIIGLAAGVVCYFAATTVKNALGYDDSLDVFGVHGVGGILGALLTGVFAKASLAGVDAPLGMLEGNTAQLGLQAYGVGVTVVYCGVVTFVILKVIDAIIGLRVSQEVEREGLDLALHGESVHGG